MSAAPLFQRFSWLRDEHRGMPFMTLIAEARDVAAGASSIVALIEREDIDSACGDDAGDPLPLLLPAGTRSDLLRLAITSLDRLVERLDECIDRSAANAAWRPVAAELVRLIPDAVCPGQLLTAEEAAGLVALRRQLQAVAASA